MPHSCRDAISDIWKDGCTPIGTNASLLMDRYLEFSVKDDKHKEARDRLHQAIGEAMVHSLETYQLAYAKNYAPNSIPAPKKAGIFRTDGRMVIGLGGENVLESGLTLQHTFGTPLIPGSALKGLAAHYCDQVWGASDARFKLSEAYHKTIFGTTEDSGHIIFHDAWIVPESLSDSLKPDVMTPHHGDYYSKKDGAAPTDYDDPNPITFLSISGQFHIVVSCDVQNEDGEKWTKFAFELLSDALCEWGIGGKTNAGYGRLVKSNGKPIAETSIEATTKAISKEQVAIAAKVVEPKIHRPLHKKGDVVEVTREADPNVRRGKPYFRADDGFGGFIQFGNAPSLEIGKKTRLEIVGVMNEGYAFAVPGLKEDYLRNKGNRGRR